MKRLRWAMDGGIWEVDMSTPITLEGESRAVGGVGVLPLGITRGTRLSRAKQVDFFQRFMSAPFVPSFSPHSYGLSLQRLLPLPLFPSSSWFASILGQFNVQQFVSSIIQKVGRDAVQTADLRTIWKQLQDKSLYALGFFTELSLSPDDTLLCCFDTYGDRNTPRKKAAFHHQFPHHNLTIQTNSPALLVDELGNYWDVPFSMAIDLGSVASDSGLSYHLCMHHHSGLPTHFHNDHTAHVPAALLPGTSLKSAISTKKNIEIWRSKAQKLRMVQPFDMFLSNPHVSASGIIGAAVTACFGDCSAKAQVINDSQGFKGICLHAPALKSALFADLFSSVSFTAQHGNFQRLFLDLTRFRLRLDFPSGSKFLSGATQLTQDYFNSQQPTVSTVQAICPTAIISLQQQIAGPFSFRMDSGVVIDLKNKACLLNARDPVFAIEYALQVLGSAKATAWYSPKHQEFMVELQFFET